ncbi:MAG: D-tyrosyl-tRNA(Tyr) deacylase [Bacteroidetes bacterium]|nr:D-tyrosyl-tRNA(Tyr) deacylase [Bacteroidota bacterium]
MRALIQRVTSAHVSVRNETVGAIQHGMVILLGIKSGDTEADAVYVAEKCSALRIFEDTEEKMNLSINDVNGSILAVSQFTLYGDTRKGNRPSFIDAAPPAAAKPLYEKFVARLRELLGNERVRTGVFGAMMQVAMVNDGPVTVLVESKN